MKRQELLLWIVILLLAAAMAVTIIWAPRRTRHGYGSVSPPPAVKRGAFPSLPAIFKARA